jgi:transposase
MARRPTSMLKQNEIKRLKENGMSVRAIARALKCSRKTIKKYLKEQGEAQANQRIETPLWAIELDWDEINKDHAVNGVPLNVLWEERNEEGKIPVQYPGFWKQYHKRFPDLPKTMVRFFEPGSRVEIDYCDGINIVNPATGELTKTHLFSGVLCNSRYTYAEFSLSQKSQDFLSSHVRMFNYFGGAPATLAPDNLKSAVTKAHKYDPDINPAYTQLATYFGIVVTPARVRTPKDKPIVERTIQAFQRWFYFRVRKKVFTSLVELNRCLHEHLELFNKKVHRIFKKSRSEMFIEEKPFLKKLPDHPYEVRVHKKATLHYDCHLQFDNNYYSSPWEHRGKSLDIWASDKVVEIFYNSECVAIHSRSTSRGKFKTNKDHYPPEHKAYLEVTPDFLRKKAEKLGPKVSELVDKLMNVDHPLRYLRRCQGLVGLSKKYTGDEINIGCHYALIFEKYHIKFIEEVIKNKRANPDTPELKINRTPNPHLRGVSSYQ